MDATFTKELIRNMLIIEAQVSLVSLLMVLLCREGWLERQSDKAVLVTSDSQIKLCLLPAMATKLIEGK